MKCPECGSPCFESQWEYGPGPWLCEKCSWHSLKDAADREAEKEVASTLWGEIEIGSEDFDIGEAGA